jgi:anti-sigma factor RsiW
MSHPSADQLEATAFGRLPEAKAQATRAHAASCPRCRAALQQDEVVRQRLELLRAGEPSIDVAEHVLGRLEHVARPRPSLRPARVAVVVLALLVAGVALACNSIIRRTVRRLGGVVLLWPCQSTSTSLRMSRRGGSRGSAPAIPATRWR